MLALVLAVLVAVDDDRLPASLEEETGAAPAVAAMTWWVGPHAGFARAYDADDPTFLVGAQGRLTGLLPWLSVEASLDAYRNEFEDGDIEVFHVNTQFSALFHPFEGLPVQPYGLAGVGFYYTRTEFDGPFASKSDKTDTDPGFHLGGGLNLDLAPGIVFHADVRFVFVQEPSGLEGNDYDYLVLGAGVNFKLSR